MREKKTQRDEKKILYYAISLTTINIILWVIALKSNPANPSRTTFLSSGVMKLILLYIPLGVSSFILGLLVSLIPYRELKFRGEIYTFIPIVLYSVKHTPSCLYYSQLDFILIPVV